MNHLKYCSFYVSDIHLITMLLPYINEKTKVGNKFITIFEKDISESANKVIKSIVLKKKEEENLISIGWNGKTNIDKINLNNKYILVMGSDEFINNVNFKLEEREEDFIIINCFEVFQAEKEIDKIIEEHTKLINTKGENEIDKIFTKCTKNRNRKITIIK